MACPHPRGQASKILGTIFQGAKVISIQPCTDPESRKTCRKPASRHPIALLYADDELLAIDKPAGLSATAPRDGGESVVQALRRQLPPEQAGGLRLVHRLDRQTSGVMVLARNVGAQRRLSTCFARGQVSKCYWALVRGRPSSDEGLIDLPIAPDPGQPGRMRVGRRYGRRAQTAWRLLERFVGLSLLACRPLTGRTHQLRVHLQAIGLPLAVDAVYGEGQPLMLSSLKPGYRASRRRPERPLIARLTLHARWLDLPAGDDRPAVHLEAPLPRDLKATLNQLRKHASQTQRDG